MKKIKCKRAVFCREVPNKPSGSKKPAFCWELINSLNISVSITAPRQTPSRKYTQGYASRHWNQNPHSDFGHILPGKTKCCIKPGVPLNAVNTHNSELCRKRGHASLQDFAPVHEGRRPYCWPSSDLCNFPLQLSTSFLAQEKCSTCHSKQADQHASATCAGFRQGPSSFLVIASHNYQDLSYMLETPPAPWNLLD